MIVLTLVQNVALLISLSVILLVITRRLGTKTLPTIVLSGLLFGLVAVVGMMTPLRLSPGVIFDGRSVVIAVAGFSGGPIVAAIAALIAIAYRLSLGGGGAWVGAGVIVISSLLGVAMYFLRGRYRAASSWPALIAFGVVVHVAMLSMQLLLPGGVGPGLVRQIGPSVIFLFSLATALVCRLLLDQEEREQSAETIRRSEVRYRLLAENTADCIWEVDLDSIGTYANPAVQNLIGYTPAEYVGLPVSAYCTPDSLRVIEEAARSAIERLPDRSARRIEAVYRHKDGHLLDAEVVYAVKVGADGAAVGFQGVTRDISARKAVEREIREQKAELERQVAERTEGLQAANEALLMATADLGLANERLRDANEAKTQFLRSMSHELRTPLNSIIGFSEILKEGLAGEINEEQQRQANMINASGKHLLAIINDILDMARIEAHQVHLEIEEFDATRLASEVAQGIENQAADKGLSFEFIAPEGPLQIRSDPRKVTQILINLLGNAIKFTETGSVRMSVRMAAPALVEFAVTDTGRGISPEMQEKVFSEYVQGAGPREEGTGLGLAISRSLAGILGGMLTLESVEGEGSTFVLSLPMVFQPPDQES